MKRSVTVLVLAVFVAMGAWSGGQKEAPVSDGTTGTVTLYTSETSSDVEGYVRQFELSNPGVSVEVFRLGTTELVARLMTELQAGSTSADVVWFADMALFERLAENGDLLKINPSEAQNIPAKYVYFDGMAYEARLIYQIIAYNTNLVTSTPTSWWDLTDSKYRGAVGSASPFVSGATVTQVATVSQDERLGWDFYKKLAANDPVVSGGNGGIAQGIASGEYAIGITVDFMARAQMKQGAPLNYIYPEEGALYVPTPVGVMAQTDVPELATQFVNYLLSVEGQIQQQNNGYMPVNRKVALPEGIPSANDIPILTTDWNFLAENRDMLLDQFAEIFGID
ncbi:MAG: ABC transporter substrate-binding protein [Alkalispirochaeta sp.]|jgi:iron(III) transport system substrate-binding protein